MKTSLLCLSALLATGNLWGADQWIGAKLGRFEAISDAGRTAAITALSQFEQFRYALGTAMGMQDLRLDPPLRIVVFRDAREMAQEGCNGIVTGRDHLMACLTDSKQLPAPLVRELTRRLLETNFTGIPPATEKALEAFFSTMTSNAVHVEWGAPPPAADRTRDWALVHELVTQPESSGRAHIYLHNIANGMDQNGAIRSLGEEPAKFNKDVDAYFAAGVFQAVQAPNRPLNPDRDFVTNELTADDFQLAKADMLGPDSEQLYISLLKANKHMVEANEGLGFLALRAGDEDKAADYFGEAYKNGSRNVIALTTYGESEKHYDVGIEVLQKALKIDPNYAPAHWALGDKYDDPKQRLAEWKIALGLAPHNVDWWATYARLNEGQKQWAEAGRAWAAAAEASADPVKRQEFLDAGAKIEQQRLDDLAAQKQHDEEEKAAELNRLKAQARKELAAVEARANAANTKKGDNAPTVDWWGDGGTASGDAGPSVSGTLTSVECAGQQLKMQVKESGGAVRTMLLADPNSISVAGGEMKFSCGVQKPRAIVIHYKPSKVAGIYGEVTGIEFK